MNRNFFSKRVRLLNKDEFDFVFKQSICVKKHGIALFSRPNKLGFSRIGFAISKKYIKRAYDRNKIKRYVREFFRLYQHNLSNLDFILTIYSKDVLCLNNHNLNTALKQLWHSCGDLYPR